MCGITKRGYDSELDRDIDLNVHTSGRTGMPRNTVIFGNGIGMALEPQYFKLESGLQYV
jgi:hypothetical protein